METTDQRIARLEAHVAELSALVDRLTTDRPNEPERSAAEAPTSSRRNVLKLAGAAAVGAVALATGTSGQAAAATGDPLMLGEQNDPDAGDQTLVNGQFVAANSSTPVGTVRGLSGALIGWDNTLGGDVGRAGVVGIAGDQSGSGTTSSGVIGIMSSPYGVGDGVVARSSALYVTGKSAGLRASSVMGPAIQLEAVSGQRIDEGVWSEGAIRPDLGGNLWYCVGGGQPGTWRKLAGPDAAGSLHCIAPRRVYDSRNPMPTPGPIVSDSNRTVSVANSRSLSTGEVIGTFLPPTATAVSINVTVTETVGSGFLTINPGGNPYINSSTINWTGPNQTVSNCVPMAVNSASEITVVCAGGGSTHFLIDVFGYYL